ncbi:MAG TPA: hypothetical protein VKP66_17865, partial [Steroidobacteraceae bacterium]|nr:hypothetical protein [Steroidobacteraceae bacterium]
LRTVHHSPFTVHYSPLHGSPVAPVHVAAQDAHFPVDQAADGNGDALVRAGDGQIGSRHLHPSGMFERAAEVETPRPIGAVRVVQGTVALVGRRDLPRIDDVIADLPDFVVEESVFMLRNSQPSAWRFRKLCTCTALASRSRVRTCEISRPILKASSGDSECPVASDGRIKSSNPTARLWATLNIG